MTTFITDEDLTQAIADMQGLLSAAELPTSYSSTIVHHSNESAYLDILAALMGRGLTKAQADTWLAGPTYNRDIGLYWVICKGNGLETLPAGAGITWPNLDRRKELATIFLISIDGPIEPDGSGQIGHGEMNTDNDFNVPDLTDARRGGPLRW